MARTLPGDLPVRGDGLEQLSAGDERAEDRDDGGDEDRGPDTPRLHACEPALLLLIAVGLNRSIRTLRGDDGVKLVVERAVALLEGLAQLLYLLGVPLDGGVEPVEMPVVGEQARVDVGVASALLVGELLGEFFGAALGQLPDSGVWYGHGSPTGRSFDEVVLIAQRVLRWARAGCSLCALLKEAAPRSANCR